MPVPWSVTDVPPERVGVFALDNVGTVCSGGRVLRWLLTQQVYGAWLGYLCVRMDVNSLSTLPMVARLGLAWCATCVADLGLMTCVSFKDRIFQFFGLLRGWSRKRVPLKLGCFLDGNEMLEFPEARDNCPNDYSELHFTQCNFCFRPILYNRHVPPCTAIYRGGMQKLCHLVLCDLLKAIRSTFTLTFQYRLANQ